ncbi:MAG: aminodeoxychorismate/anthranilate synthase component II [Lachnospiraceae bacterium]|nr:aminodeoxychorismate/anthranilate synthase component II [Lachnospiraceae bacterium]
MILLIDNYDSFSYNLYQLIGMINPDIRVIRNDAMNVEEIRGLSPERIILSPGPGYPKDAGVCIEVARELGKEIPILGVCLGHQAICEAFGATISHARRLMHGKQSQVRLDTDCPLFRGMKEIIPVARYHSLAAIRETLPDVLKTTAQTEDGEVMAVQHRDYPIYGVQFHPESVLTPDRQEIFRNFVTIQNRSSHLLRRPYENLQHVGKSPIAKRF